MNNVFLVGTPLQLLAAYIIANQIFPEAINQLLLIHPMGEAIWSNSTALSMMSNDEDVWRQVIKKERWLSHSSIWSYPAQMNDMKERLLAFGKVDQVFLGSDKIIQNQLLVELLGHKRYARIDDGIWSYHSRDRRKLSKIWQYLRVQGFRCLGSIEGELQYNYGGLGHGKAGIADYLFKPQLLERSSPLPVCIEKETVQMGINKVVQKMGTIPEMLGDDCLLFLGSTMVESGFVEAESEKDIIEKIYKISEQNGLKMVYKPHPREDRNKLEKYADLFFDLKLIKNNDPVEILYARQQNLKWVLSIRSSGLLFADVFSKNIIPIGLFKLLNAGAQDKELECMMIKAGVVVPENIEQLQKLIISRFKFLDREIN